MPVLDVQLDITWLSLLATVILPQIVALATARLAHSGLKAGVLAVLTLATTAANELLANDGTGTFDTSSWLATALGVFLGAVGMHYGLLKPINVTGADGVIQRSVTGGLGGGHRTVEGEVYGDR